MKIGVIGIGTIGEIFLRGLKQAQGKNDLFAYDRNASKLEFAQQNYHAVACKDELDCTAKAQLIFLCVKPKDILPCLKRMAAAVRAPKTIVSVAAGITMDRMLSVLPQFDRIARVMPNTPCLINKGALAFCAHPNLDEESQTQILSLIQTMGWTGVIQNETDMDLMTALIGSGPAFVYTFASALIRTATERGIDNTTARKIVLQVLIGAAGMMEQSDQAVEGLIRAVVTPKGTTEAGLEILEKQKFASIIQSALAAATERARALADA